MLVLSRSSITHNADKSVIVIDGDIEITVLDIKSNKVRLGISAPANVKVLRGEIRHLPPKEETEPDLK